MKIKSKLLLFIGLPLIIINIVLIAASYFFAESVLVIGIITTIVMLIIIYMVANSISKPLSRLSNCIQSMVSYDLTLTEASPSVIYSDNTDEIGEVSRALVQVKKTLQALPKTLQKL